MTASWGQPLIFTATLTSGSTSSAMFRMEAAHEEVWIGFPDMSALSADAAIFIQAAANSSTTFMRLAISNTQTATVGTTDYQIKSGTSSRWVNIPDCPFGFMKVETSAAPTADIIFKIVAH